MRAQSLYRGDRELLQLRRLMNQSQQLLGMNRRKREHRNPLFIYIMYIINRTEVSEAVRGRPCEHRAGHQTRDLASVRFGALLSSVDPHS